MKKKRFIIITFIVISSALTSKIASAQITLTSQLLDSIISNTVLKDVKNINKSGAITRRNVLSFSYKDSHKTSICMSYTYFVRRKALPLDACIYCYNDHLYYILVDKILISDDLMEKIVRPETVLYDYLLDSIDFDQEIPSGLHLERSKLVVYEISIERFTKRKYLITSKTYIPYATAPDNLKPHFPIEEERRSNTELGLLYIDPRHTYTDFYYEEMKPIIPRTITLKRE